MKVLASKLLVVATLLIGLALNTQGADKQTLCPLMIEDEIDAEEFVTYKGVKVFVCCGTCKKMWAQNPDYYAVVSKKQAPQLAKVASKEIKPMKQLFCPVYADTRVHPKSPELIFQGKDAKKDSAFVGAQLREMKFTVSTSVVGKSDDGHDIISMKVNGKKVYFSKTRAVSRFTSNPAKYSKNLLK